MDFKACSDLKSHHGQVLRHVPDETTGEMREVKIDNSCPRCGFFSAKRNAWPRWDGKIHEEELASPWEATDLAAKKYLPLVKKAEREREQVVAAAGEMSERLREAAEDVVGVFDDGSHLQIMHHKII